jgi:aqualysin 1
MKVLPVAVAVAIILITACSEQPSGPVPQGSTHGTSVAPLLKEGGDSSLPDRYIVVFKAGTDRTDALIDELARAGKGTVHYRYHYALKGFAATLPPQALDGVRHNPNVDYIEADGIATKNASPQTSPPSWGLDRIDQRGLPLDNSYTYTGDGSGVTAYIIDTGIYFAHSEFGGRASSGRDCVDNDDDASDCDGHGTHVAGTVGGITTGVAKNVTLVAVRVLNCNGSGTWSQVIAGIDWVTQHHSGPSVANMSLGGGYSSSVNQAVNNSVASGVVYCVAAGNSGANASNYSPASAANAITVGATTSADVRASWSNYGSAVDIFAPGAGITSSVMTGGYDTWSGTSMATPHVTGVAALYLQGHTSASPATVTAAIINSSTQNALSSIGTGSPNKLLYSLLTLPTQTPMGVTAFYAHKQSQAKNNWIAAVDVTVRDGSSNPVSGATVTISLSGGTTGTKTGVTDASGQCSISTASLKNNVSSVTMTVTDVTKTGYWYNSSLNTVSTTGTAIR